MPDLAVLEPSRVSLPFTIPAWGDVAAYDGVITLDRRRMRPVDALDLSAALVRAVRGPAAPFTTRAGDTVCTSRGVIYLNAHDMPSGVARDTAAALARAVHETALTNHTNQQGTNHG